MSSLLLTSLLVLPLAGALLVMLVPREEEAVARGIGIGTSVVTFLVSLGCWIGFDVNQGGYQFVADKTWIASFGIHYKVGLDGISLWLLLLTTFLTPIVLLSATKAIQKKVKEFVIAFLILETGMIGTFIAIDLFLFYVMWEVMLIPMYFIIGVWGGDRRVYASIKFVIYTMVGSLLMLVAIFYLYVMNKQATGSFTFDLATINNLQLPQTAQMWCFAAFALAFAIKVPLWPLHTWLPDAHVEAPTAGSVILAGVLLKFGVYGMIRFALPLFPYAAHTLGPVLLVLAVIGIVYGAIVSYAQDDVKKLVAYSSVSHLAFCVFGIFALNTAGLAGALFASLSHGLTTSGLFLGIGVLYERRHTRKLSDYGGIWKQMPVFGGIYMIITLGSAGLPGLSGFVGEFLCLIGGYEAGSGFRGIPYLMNPWPPILTGIATVGVILGAVYLLTMFQRVFFGPSENPRNKGLKDLSAREIAVFAPLILFIFILGLFPRPFLNAMERSVERLRQHYDMKLRDSMAHTDEVRVVNSEPPVTAPSGDDTVPSPLADPPAEHDHDHDAEGH